MNGKSKSALFCALALALAIGAVGVRSAAAQAPPAPVPRHDQTNEQFYKNIQVMKGLPADLMQPSMQFMEIALGVHCVYCHDDDNTKRDLDTKPTKTTARAMLRMVNDINKNTFGGREVVSCYTCHRGKTNPVETLPFNSQPARSTEVVPATMPTVDQLLTNYTNVLGGAEALAKVGGRAWKGTVSNYAHIDQVHPERTPTIVTPVEIFAKGTDKRMVVQHNIGGDALNTYNGTSGWAKAGNGAAADLRVDQLDVAKLENAVISPSQFKTLLQGLRVVGQDKVGGHTAWVVSGHSANMPEVKLYFDTGTSYLLSAMYQLKSDFCCHQFRIDYDNWYVLNGVRVPMQWTSNGPREAVLVYKFDTAQVTAIDDTRFVKPAAPRGN